MSASFNRMKSAALSAAKAFGSHTIMAVLDAMNIPEAESLNKRLAKVPEAEFATVVEAVQALGAKAAKPRAKAKRAATKAKSTAKKVGSRAKAATKKAATKAKPKAKAAATAVKKAVQRVKRSEAPELQLAKGKEFQDHFVKVEYPLARTPREGSVWAKVVELAGKRKLKVSTLTTKIQDSGWTKKSGAKPSLTSLRTMLKNRSRWGDLKLTSK